MELVFLALLIVLMAFALGSGYPVAFALPGSAIISIVLAALCGYLFAGDTDAYFAHGGPAQWLSAGVTNLRGVYWEPERDTLIAIPLFIFMGIMLQRSKIAEDLLVTMAQLFGPVPGGLGISVVVVGALLAATTGIVGATVVAMGLISLPAMLKHNYSKALATGTIAASGTLGQIIPPSIVLIILADQLASAVDQADTARKTLFRETTGEVSMPSEFGVVSTSAGDMFLGAMVPGLVLVGLYIAFILIIALLRPKLAPAVHYEGKYDRRFAGKVALTLIPPLTLIFLVLGSIIGGIATVNQAGAIGAVGAMVMAGYRLYEGRPRAFYPAILALVSLTSIGLVLSFFDTNVKSINTTSDQIGVTLGVISVLGLVTAIAWSGFRAFRTDDTLTGVMIETAKTTSLVFIILLGAAMLTAAFRAFGGEELVRDFLNGLPGGFWSKFIIVMAVIFVLGFFLDFIEIAVVVVPIVAPILLADPSANVTAVWLGVMIGLNIQTSFLTPPFGFALFYLRGVAPAIVKTIQMYKGVIAFIGLQLLALVIVGVYPALVNYLPNRVALTSETAPPPLNPRLQYCLEQYVDEQFAARGDTIRGAITRAQSLDISYLPEDLREELEESFEKAASSFDRMADIKAAEAAIAAAADAYRPLHRQVRDIESAARRLAERIEDLETTARRSEDGSRAQIRAEERITDLTAEREALLASIPEAWEAENGTFSELVKAERTARLTYRRNADDAYEPVDEMNKVLADAATLKALNDRIVTVREDVAAMSPEQAVEYIEEKERLVDSVAGTRDIKRLLSRARRALRKRTPEPEEADAELAAAVEAYQADIAWRERAAAELSEELTAYQVAIRDTIGLRSQPRMTREQSLYTAACNADHRDISLNF
ncbi:MAG: TRAP transporter large permease subunit [Pseudomonadota bacterium]